ncbi:MAG TPA: sulfotransferase [Sphingomicrobium sp.]|nr:sulfotransferase [Sphingomicrobium sp.]
MTAEILDDLDALALDSPARAHEEARRRVAENPNSEEAALQLRDLIRKYPPVSLYPSPDPLEGAAPAVKHAAELLEQDKAEEAEIGLRAYLKQAPNDPSAMRLMAQIAMANGFLDNAYKILVRSLEIDRTRADNWAALGTVLHRIATQSGKLETVEEALAALDHAARLVPGHLEALSYKAAILIQLRRLDEAAELFVSLLKVHPGEKQLWSNYAFLLKTLGRFGDSVAAYRTSVALDGGYSEGWWGLANLKLARFFSGDLAEMEQDLGNLRGDSKVKMHMALAKAYDFEREYEHAADHLDRGNSLRLQRHPYHPERLHSEISNAIDIYTPGYFTKRRNAGDRSRAPIFIVGMPRSGSTLVEQILSSHSMVEATEELFAIQQIDGELTSRGKGPNIDSVIAELDHDQLARVGAHYLQLTRYFRSTERPRFTDKNPANWRHVGLIHSILPNAKIIDTRRNPLDCCFANYAQYFNWGVNYASSQSYLGLHYRQYLRLMRHFDAVLPGTVHHLIHEDLIENLEDEVRRLLDYLELPFEDNCLRFFETKRAVHTPSSEQVRQPINKSGVGRWRNYEPWLSELKESLGEALGDWRS